MTSLVLYFSSLETLMCSVPMLCNPFVMETCSCAPSFILSFLCISSIVDGHTALQPCGLSRTVLWLDVAVGQSLQ